MVDESITSQISEKRLKLVDAMSKDELRYEIERGGSMSLVGLIPYMKLRLAEIEEGAAAEARAEDVSIAKEANRLSKVAIVLSIVALIVALIVAGFTLV